MTRLEEGIQSSFLPDSQVPKDKSDKVLLQRRRGLLLRILQPKTDGQLREAKKRIEQNFKAGGMREERYFYAIKSGEEKTVDATPEDIDAVISMRHPQKHKSAVGK